MIEDHCPFSKTDSVCLFTAIDRRTNTNTYELDTSGRRTYLADMLLPLMDGMDSRLKFRPADVIAVDTREERKRPVIEASLDETVRRLIDEAQSEQRDNT